MVGSRHIHAFDSMSEKASLVGNDGLTFPQFEASVTARRLDQEVHRSLTSTHSIRHAVKPSYVVNKTDWEISLKHRVNLDDVDPWEGNATGRA